MKIRSLIVGALLGVVLCVVGVRAQVAGTSTAQLQNFYQFLLATPQTWTGAQTFTATTTVGTLVSTANLISSGSVQASAAGLFYWTTRASMVSPADGQINFTNAAATSGAGFDVTSDGVLSIRTRAQSGYATVNALAYQTSGTAGVGFAAVHAQPANQTGNATATLKMNGLGAAAAPCKITPTSTGRIIFVITGDMNNSVTSDGTTYNMVWGTGAIPANAATAIGTIITPTRTFTQAVGGQLTPFTLFSMTTASLTLNVPVWFDMQIADVTGGTSAVLNVDCTAHEL